MQITPKGYRKPEDGDTGNVWSDAIEFDIDKIDALETRFDDLNIADINRDTTILDSGDWIVDPSGKGYKQTVAAPVGITLDKVGMRYRVTSGPKQNIFVNPTIRPISLSAFDIIVNDSTLNIEILYL